MPSLCVRSRSLVVLAFLALFTAFPSQAQQDPTTAQGFTPYGSFQAGDIDSVNLFNGNVMLNTPLISYPQRGGKLRLTFRIMSNGKQATLGTRWNYPLPFSSPLVQVIDDQGAGISGTNVSVHDVNNDYATDTIWSIATPDGSLSTMALTSRGFVSVDGTGFFFGGSNYRDQCTSQCAGVLDSNGILYPQSGGSIVREDPNGNQITSANGGYVDTLGRIIPAYPPRGNNYSPGISTTDFSGCAGPLPIYSAYLWNLPGPQGGTTAFKFCWVQISVDIPSAIVCGSLRTGFGPYTYIFLQSILLPNGTSWVFQYNDRNIGDPSTVNYGGLTQVSLPTGGAISYTYTTFCSWTGSRAVATRTVNANDGTGAHTWTYTWGAGEVQTRTNVVTDPLGNDTVHKFTQQGGQGPLPYETETDFYSGSQSSGTVLKTVTTSYTIVGNPNYGYVGAASYGLPQTITTTWPSGQVQQIQKNYDTIPIYAQAAYSCCTFNRPGSYGKVLSETVSDYGSGSPGPLLRQTFYTYMALSGPNASAYLNNNMLSLPYTVQTLNGSGTQMALTQYNYDESTLAASGLSSGNLWTSAPLAGADRGNDTSVYRWLNSGTLTCPNGQSGGSASNVISTRTYFDTGSVNTSSQPCKNTTSYSYSLTYEAAFPTTVTNALNQSSNYTYDFNTGLLTSGKDPNSQTTSFSYDSMWRIYQINHPDGGLDTVTHQESTFPFTATLTSSINSSQNEVQTNVFDGLGRVFQAQLNSDPNGVTYTDTTYDAVGRVHSVSNPHLSSSSVTDGVKTYTYDPLGRTTLVTHPDGATVQTAYTGPATQVNDEGNGTQSVERIAQVDGLGRLISVCEVTSASVTGSGSTPTACGQAISATGFVTTYQYDALGDLLQVNQAGVGGRTFSYDSLSRLITATNPESGTICYGTVSAGTCQANGYDPNGNLTFKTDARNITTTHTYDPLNRLTGKTYSDGTTPAVTFTYDVCPTGGCPSGVSPQLPVGRMVHASTANTGTFFSYDAMGRVTTQWQCTPLNCGTGNYALNFAYDFNGDLTSETNGFGVTLTNTYDGAARLSSTTSNLSDANHPANLLSNVQYDPLGLPRSDALGNTVTETLGYNSRMRLVSLSATSPTATPATAGTGTGTVSGSENSRQNPGAPGKGSFTITGSERSTTVPYQVCVPIPPHGIIKCTTYYETVYDTGTITVTVNGYPASTSYGQNSTTSTIASALASALSASGMPVTAAASGSSVFMTATTIGTATDYSWSSTSATTNSNFTGTSFPISPTSGTLSGGQNAATIYDTGTVSITVNGATTSASYGNGSTAASVASALASGLSNGSFVNATANGSVVTITSKTVGANTNYSLSTSNSSSNGFSPPSFSASASGGSLTGGSGPTPGTAYALTVNYAPDGDVLSANDSANGNWTYGYDPMNRLTSANASGQAYTYVYDRFGNRWQQNGPYSFQATFTGNNPGSPANNNRIDGYSYDAAGNLLNDGSHSYAYDAESRIVQVDGGATTYIYGANGRRVEKNVSGAKTDYLYDLQGNAIVEVNASGAASREEIFVGSKHLATYTGGTTYFQHTDWLATERIRTNMTGAVCESITSLPFGDGQSVSGSCGDPSARHFTGKERDSESNLDNFGARYYSSSMGRFVSPDPLQPSRSHPLVLDQFLADPQNWNKYAYSLDNPVTYRDRDGHFTGDDHERIQMNAMLAHGYSQRAAQVAATSDRHMDNLHNMASGVPVLHHFVGTQENPQHGERADGQTREQAQAAASQFISTKTGDAAERALRGDVSGALADLGQASHTAQDIVRHNFEAAAQHPMGEAPATPAEVQAATQATNNVLDEFTNQVYALGLQEGLSFGQIAGIMQNVLQGPPPPPPPPPQDKKEAE